MNVLFVGRMDRQKGLDVLLSAFNQLPADRFKLRIVGASVADSRNTPLPVLPNVEFVGWLPYEEVSRHIGEADVLVVPSRWEGFGLVAVEAHSRSVPVVATRTSSLPEIVEHGRTGFLFDVDDEATLAEILRSTPREQWREMGVAGKASFEKRFTEASMLQETAQLYDRVIASSAHQERSWQRPFVLGLFNRIVFGKGNLSGER